MLVHDPSNLIGPVMEHDWINISAVGPFQCAKILIQPDHSEHTTVSQFAKHWPSQDRFKIYSSYRSIIEDHVNDKSGAKCKADYLRQFIMTIIPL